MSDNTQTPSAVANNVQSAFWSTLEHMIIRPQTAVKPTINPSSNDNISLDEQFTLRLNELKNSDSIQIRLKKFEELIKLSELFNLNEKFINSLLEATRSLFRSDQTPLEYRKQAFEYLKQLYQKQSERFETLMLKNHLLILLILNTSTLTSSNCMFLYLFVPILKNFHTESPVPQTCITNCDDIKQRFVLFIEITKNGTCCTHLDQKLTTECLLMFLKYSNGLTTENHKQLFDLYKNIIQNEFFHLLEEPLILQLSKFVLNFSYETLKQIDNVHQFNKSQQMDLKSCIDLCEKLCPNLITSETVTNVLIVLCEMLEVNTHKNTDKQICVQIYECMSLLLNGTIGHASLYNFFTQIFRPQNRLQTFRLQQINGALMHLKQLFDDFRQTKMKNTFFIKEIHLNCLVYLPIALKSCSYEHQLILFENILSLSLDLVHLATHRDLYMCLLTFNSRRFIIEIIDQSSMQINIDNKNVIQKYADLLNVLDNKNVFTYKTGSSFVTIDESNSIEMLKFKENFCSLVYNFPHINHLSESCINNCVEYYLSRKLLPSNGKHSIKGIRELIEKYFSIKNSKNIIVRKNVIEAVCKKLFDYNRIEYKTFIDDVIQKALLPCLEQAITEDNYHYHSLDNDPNASIIMHSDLVEMKSFTICKLIEIAPICHYEENVLKIIDILNQIINLEKSSCIEQLNIQNLVISTNTTPISKSSAILSPTPIVLPNQNNQHYLSRTINALIDLFERHHFNSSNCMTKCCTRIYSILVNYLDSYYDINHNKIFSLSTIAAESLAFQQQQHQQQSQQRSSISLPTPDLHLQPRNFNYYAQIRRDIFDFLFRIRSDKENRVHLLNRNDRKKHTDSKYLILVLNKSYGLSEDYTSKCVLDYSKFLNLMEACLEKEIDWNVLMKILTDLPFVLQYEMSLIINSEFIQNIFKLLYRREVNTFKNRPETLTRPDYICRFYPLIASLILYHQCLDKSSQEIILQNFAIGISSSRSRFCLETLTIAMTEMHETNAKQCAEILLKLSQFSPSQNMAQPVLELLSTISDLKKLDSTIFGRKEFIAVSAIAIKYTDPLKFNPFIILLAHYVICIWFIKCKQDFRKNYASFTCKGLYQEVIVQLDRLNKSKKESKSPSRQTSEETTLKQRAMTVGGVATNPVANTLNVSDDSKLNVSQTKTILTESMKVFYRELVEITLDFMSNNMFFDNTQQTSYSNSGQREFLVDIYSNASLATSANSTLRNNSLIDNSTASALSSTNATVSNKANTQSRSWICGNKIVQIKTGLFSNICVEEPNSNLSRKQRVNSTTKKTTSTLTPENSQNSSKVASSLAINIPNQQSNSKSSDSKKSIFGTAQNNANDSYASSESSTNNSFNLAKQIGDRDLDAMSQTRKSSLLATDSDHGKHCDEASLSAKSDQDYFEEAINEQAQSAATLLLDDENNQENEATVSAVKTKLVSSGGLTRNRNNLMKRRYKSGIPLSSNERSDDDLLDETNQKQYNDTSTNKQSKDDSDLSLASSLSCLKNKSSADESQTDNLYLSAKNLNNNQQSSIITANHSHRNSQRSTGTNQRNHSSKNYSDNISIDSRRQDSDGSSPKEMCLPTCWCNNLVEVTCRYPTKVVTYVSLIDSTSCASHELNLSLIELQQQQQRMARSKETKNVLKSNQIAETVLITDNETTLTPDVKANAVELRRNLSLSRISESSISQQELSSANSNQSLESRDEPNEQYNQKIAQQASNTTLAKIAIINQIAQSHTSNQLNKSFYENDLIYRPALMRKASFDSTIPPSNIIATAAARIPYHDISSTSSNRKQINIVSSPNNEQTSSSPNGSITQTAFNQMQSRQQPITSIDPSQVFLHLFQQTTQPYSTPNENKDQQPMMIPENSASQRSMNILDYLPCYLIHKIGVVYVGRNQAHDEKAILSNASGSQRYKNFINGLGQLMRLKDLDTNRYYSGGLETDGSAGEFTLIWFDGIIQVVFHVATMMPLREDNCNAKKKHIGNDATLIVFNESGEEYQFNMIKGEVNCVCIEIEPLSTSNTNLVRVKTTNELAQSSWIIHQDQKFVSDQNLAIVARKIALHADIASRCYRFQKDNNGNNPYGGKWYERLKQINRIRKSCKEFYAKQQPVKSGAQTTTATSSTNQPGTQTANMPTGQTNNDVQFDFTEYI